MRSKFDNILVNLTSEWIFFHHEKLSSWNCPKTVQHQHHDWVSVTCYVPNGDVSHLPLMMLESNSNYKYPYSNLESSSLKMWRIKTYPYLDKNHYGYCKHRVHLLDFLIGGVSPEILLLPWSEPKSNQLRREIITFSLLITDH